MQKLLTDQNTQKETLGALALVLASISGSFENEYVRGAIFVTMIAAWAYRWHIKAQQSKKKR